MVRQPIIALNGPPDLARDLLGMRALRLQEGGGGGTPTAGPGEDRSDEY